MTSEYQTCLKSLGTPVPQLPMTIDSHDDESCKLFRLKRYGISFHSPVGSSRFNGKIEINDFEHNFLATVAF
jgi:hypothetical protein